MHRAGGEFADEKYRQTSPVVALGHSCQTCVPCTEKRWDQHGWTHKHQRRIEEKQHREKQQKKKISHEIFEHHETCQFIAEVWSGIASTILLTYHVYMSCRLFHKNNESSFGFDRLT
ncbi:uncharacterized protein LOC128250334 [Octopus bimaculoides]|uniref:uncharacterized protein LOC128250334 n=1 Tax=Octopus bimaculoides TaxID=37653 RepID=UPI0022E5D4AE|nr:uncharacterized protein LOC128250334 [Octopus bimaculoides]